MRNPHLLPLLGLLAGHLLAQRAALPTPRIVAGSLTGTVATPDGRPVARATVMLRLQPGTGVNLPGFTIFATANPRGEFSLPMVPVGKYTLCPQAPDEDVINPCDWSRQPPEVEILNGVAAAAKLTMAKGHRVRFQVNDGGRILESNASRARPPAVTVGVTTPHGFLAARPNGRSPIQRDFVMVVPYATPVDAFMLADGVDLEDDAGKKAENRSLRFPLRLKPGDPPKSANARITGLRAN